MVCWASLQSPRVVTGGPRGRGVTVKTKRNCNFNSLELFHAHIWGSTNPSIGVKRYFLLFVDDYSSMMWVNFLEISEAFSHFMQFKVLTENQNEHSIKILRTNRGGEFTSNEFNSFCKKHGIKRELTARCTPQQNGIAKRKNRTIAETARNIIQGKHLLKRYWAKAVQTAVYILNRSPTQAVKDLTPYEAWHKSRAPQSVWVRSLCPHPERESGKTRREGRKMYIHLI